MILLLWFSIITLFLMLSFELLLRFLVKKHGNRLKEFPKSTMEQLSRFKNYDEELGWETKPTGPIIDYGHSNVLEHGQSIAKYSINMDGSRYQPSEGNNKGILVEFFGDSACFCRDVNDNETFQSYLENDLDFGVCKNYGVGNYGPDQAVIRAKRKMKGNSIGVLYMPISSLTRILTVYKQYSEITNCWAVKPRYIIKNQKLVLINRPFTNIEELMDLSKYKDHLRKYDYYYQSFKKKELSKKNCYIGQCLLICNWLELC